MSFVILGTPSTSGVKTVTRRYLYGIMRDQNLPNLDAKLNYLENHLLSNYGTTDDDLKTIKQRFTSFKSVVPNLFQLATHLSSLEYLQGPSVHGGVKHLICIVSLPYVSKHNSICFDFSYLF